MLISIVGKSASGKSSIAGLLSEKDAKIVHIDIDKISHEVLTFPDVQAAIALTFGKDIVANNVVQRKKLGKKVFTSKVQMDKLTEITWPYMEEIIDQQIQEHTDEIILLDWLLLPKTKYFENSDLRIWVEAPLEERISRAIRRSGSKEEITAKYFIMRDESGIDYEPSKYDIVIKNFNGTRVEDEVNKIYEKSIISR